MARPLLLLALSAGLATASALAASGAPRPAAQTTRSLESLPPVVVEAHPAAGAVGVDPDTRELRLRFSQPMEPAGHSFSWELSDLDELSTSLDRLELAPEYDAETRTFTIPVELEPATTYAFWLNVAEFEDCDTLVQSPTADAVAVRTTLTLSEEGGFRSTKGAKALPYLLSFRTAE